MAIDKENVPRPIRPGISPDKTPQDADEELMRFAETLAVITRSIIENAATGDGKKVVAGIEQAIRDSGLTPFQREMAREGFNQFTRAFFAPKGPQIVQRPNLRVLRNTQE